MPKVALLTMEGGQDHVPDDHLIIPPLQALGFDVTYIPWTDRQTDWSQIDHAIIRSTFDYTNDTARFIARLHHMEAAGANLLNPFHVVKWNATKTYLADLRNRDVAIVPSLFGLSGSLDDLQRAADQFGCRKLIAKPAIGAGGNGVTIIDMAKSPDRLPDLQQAPGDLILQPFLECILTEGEYSVMYFGGRYSHSVRKTPQAGNILVQEEHGGTTVPFEASDGLLSNACSALMASAACCNIAADALLYARIDLLCDLQNNFVVNEVELIEPQLFFHLGTDAPDLFAEAFNSLAKR